MCLELATSEGLGKDCPTTVGRKGQAAHAERSGASPAAYVMFPSHRQAKGTEGEGGETVVDLGQRRDRANA